MDYSLFLDMIFTITIEHVDTTGVGFETTTIDICYVCLYLGYEGALDIINLWSHQLHQYSLQMAIRAALYLEIEVQDWHLFLI